MSLQRFWFLNSVTFDAGSSSVLLRSRSFRACFESFGAALVAQNGQKAHPGCSAREHFGQPGESGGRSADTP